MEIRYNRTGAERKELVKAMSEILNVKSKYMGMPTMAYQLDYFTVDTNGTVSFDDRADSEEIENLIEQLAERGFIAEPCEEYAEEDEQTAETVEAETEQNENAESEASETETEENETAEAEAETEQNENEETEIADEPTAETETEETEATAETDTEPSETADEPTAGTETAEDTPQTEKVNELVIEMPKDGFTETAIDNLKKIVESKAELLKCSLQTDELPIEITEEKIAFPWFRISDGKAGRAYLHLITALCETAKKQKRVTAKPKESTNMKYDMRCWLLRLGFIGKEYKDERKVLLKHLEGSSAFKTVKAGEEE